MSRFVVGAALVVLILMALSQGHGCTTAADYPPCAIACTPGTVAP